ncbi:hypothetical protein [uncultured Alsobacter sp.]|uniref:hypothetical protein n=1 Tax=uncultured Alsobacter sp. TaxID=1748258 RepID=UPI0025F6473E|nr:hypothetical protein [uncultured Alsobacter sp.]
MHSEDSGIRTVAGWTGPADRMPEAEVALRLAEYLSERPGFGGHVDVAIDGASVRVAETEVFDIVGFLAGAGWIRGGDATSKNAWAASYRRGDATLRVHSRPGQGDVAAIVNGRRVVAECKKGPLVKKPGSPEYPLLTLAIGQALLFDADDTDLVVAAVPDTPSFRRIAEAWRAKPRLRASGIEIALVSRTGSVSGLSV